MQTLKELKAKAYDLIALLERARAELDQVNKEIAKLSQEEESKKPVIDMGEVKDGREPATS